MKRPHLGAWSGRTRTLAAVGLVALVAGCGLGPQEQARQLGQAWFEGRLPLKARMVSHGQDLPASAAACINCHGARSPGERFAVALDRRWLTQAQPRRGGPASRYDAQAFCRVLREGVDPAWVVVNQTMPRYDLTDLQCQALWLHLTRAEGVRAPG